MKFYLPSTTKLSTLPLITHLNGKQLGQVKSYLGIFREVTASLRLSFKMSPIERLLSEARMTADETTQDESDFNEVRSKRKRFRKQAQIPITNVRPIVVSIDPRPSQIQFARAIRSNFPVVKIKHIRELKNNTDFFIQPEDLASRECPMLTVNLTQAFPNATVNARNTLPKPKTKPSFVIVNVHHSISVDEIKIELLNNNAMNVNKVTRITSRATGQPTNLIRVITDSNNHVSAAQKHGVKISWQLYRCEASRQPPHVMQCFKCQQFGHSAKECSNATRCLRCSQEHSVKECTVQKKTLSVLTVAVLRRQFIAVVRPISRS